MRLGFLTFAATVTFDARLAGGTFLNSSKEELALFPLCGFCVALSLELRFAKLSSCTKLSKYGDERKVVDEDVDMLTSSDLRLVSRPGSLNRPSPFLYYFPCQRPFVHPWSSYSVGPQLPVVPTRSLPPVPSSFHGSRC